ncbi:histone chaperone [Plectosphaerella cucumerina]|uniref:Histone chaperone n=1 Tax=Plectosphaerella cucumerina TaxID=40658 RepID=A0A8K0TM32_9PEZI|nr:histone chaperone [Plectosphaerella cucumerina]
MPSGLDSQRLDAIFQARPDILQGIKQAADSSARVTLFNNIASFVHEQLNGTEPAAKRRRVDDGAPTANGFTASNTKAQPLKTANGSTSSDAMDENVQLVIKEISVSVPQRKKFDLCFTDTHLFARAPGATTPAPGIAYAWRDIEFIFYVPVPEKTQVQHNYVIMPRGTALPAKSDTPPAEPLVFTVPATAPKPGTILGPKAGVAEAVSDTYRSLFDWAIAGHLAAVSSPATIVASNPTRFHSMVRQPHRPNEKAVHVKAFRGSKDGYLFFLETGILWGFKKPLLFIPLERIAAVSYTSVLQRTFNIVVEAFTGEGNATEEFEFAMLDQEDYQGIDESYVKRNRLQDRSMADQRRAKMELTENLKAKKGEDAAVEGGAPAGDGMTELERAHAEAEQQLQDEEDEEEEDYDPGSEGDSEGEGETSDEDDDDDTRMGNGEDDDEEEEEEEEGDEEGGAAGARR